MATTHEPSARSPAAGRPAETQALELTVEGMSCASCAARLEGTLRSRSGVAEARVNLAANRARLVFDPEAVTLEELVAAAEKIGYGIAPASVDGAGAEAVEEASSARGCAASSWPGRSRWRSSS